jgi:hypothetical protein
MNRRGFVGVLAGLLGAMGLRGQEPPFTGMAGCVVPCKQDPRFNRPGEEYCPLGHSQKPSLTLTIAPYGAGVAPLNYPELLHTLHFCSVCGIVYVPPEKKG